MYALLSMVKRRSETGGRLAWRAGLLALGLAWAGVGAASAQMSQNDPADASAAAGPVLAAPVEAGKALHVFLIGGQSNANGHAIAADLPESLKAPQTDVFY